MNKKIAKYLEGNWDELKGKVQKKWSKLTDDDLLKIEGSYNQLAGKLQQLYADKIGDIEDEISSFLNDHGFKHSVKEIATEADSMKNIIFEYLEDYFKNLKEKSNDMEEKTKQSIKENPLKWLGLAALGGIIIAKLI